MTNPKEKNPTAKALGKLAAKGILKLVLIRTSRRGLT